MYYLCSKNKGADQLLSYRAAGNLTTDSAQLICPFVFAYAKNRFSHDVPQIIRILHECEVLIEKSVPRVTVWHYSAEPRDAKL